MIGTEMEVDILIKLNTSIDDFIPARDYEVINEASKNWSLALEELRQAARDHSHLHRLTGALRNGNPDLWMFGLAPVPEHL